MNIKKQSFTLIELLVVVAITGMIAGLIFANLRAGGHVSDINADAEKLSEIIKQAQMMSLSGKQIAGVRPDGGYGIYLDTSTSPHSYKLFVNDSLVSNYEYDASDTLIRQFYLVEQISFDSIGHTSILFIPPKGTIYVSTGTGGSVLSANSLITLKHLVNLYTYVEVNAQGQVDVRKIQ